jgi:NADH-quinone oxidoreductase subunit N
MFLREPTKDTNTVYYNLSKPLMAVIGLATVATITAVMYVQPLISYIYYMVSVS